MAVDSSANPSVYRQSITINATVSVAQSGMIPGGSLAFTEGATTLGVVQLASGRASLALADLPIGEHSIVASYSGDTNFQSASKSHSQAVHQRATSILIVVSPGMISEGQSSIATATVTDIDAGTQSNPEGSVTLSSSVADETVVGGCNLVPVGNNAAGCQFSVTSPDNGVRIQSGAYTGNSIYKPSLASAALTVNNAPPIIDSITGPNGPVGGLATTSQ